MDNKLQELTEKIYSEGVERGKAKADELLRKAQSEADAIVAKANADAAQIMTDAKKRASELDGNTRSELKLFTQQAINSLKTDITNLVTNRVTDNAVKAATSDTSFMQGIIRYIAEAWVKDGNVTIETAKADELTAFFQTNAAELLNKGVNIVSSKDGATSFTIIPENGGFKVTIGDDELTAYFKEFIRPKLVEMLF